MAEENKFPSEVIDLPSKGKVYSKESPLKDGIQVSILKILPKNKLKRYIIKIIGDLVNVMKYLNN